MSHASGISSLQQTNNSITPLEAKPAIQVGEVDNLTQASAVSVANVEHADQTNLSSAGGLVVQALGGEDTRSAKVASLQQAIAAGTYNVPSSSVADKIIESLLD
jgi:negative regulator of flagellin synthesis FlgM